MSDLDALRSRGIPLRALVDGAGIAKNGTKTLAQLLSMGVQPICQVDSSGVDVVGSIALNQLRSRGIQSFCLVDETGVEVGGSATVGQIRSRGIRPMCAVDISGVALNGTATLNQLRSRGLDVFCPVDETGTVTTFGASISFSGSVVEGSAENTVVATPTLNDPQGEYQPGGTWAIDSQERANWFKITNSATGQVLVGSVVGGPDYETDSSPTITLSYNDGVLTPLTQAFTITVTDVVETANAFLLETSGNLLLESGSKLLLEV